MKYKYKLKTIEIHSNNFLLSHPNLSFSKNTSYSQ